MAVAVSGSPVQAPALSSPKPLFESPELARYAFSTYDITPDGRRFVEADQVEDASNIIRIVLNWYEEFRAREQD
jgi:hypothetical protein